MTLIKRRSILLLLAFLLVQPCILHSSHSSNNFTDQSALIAFKSEISFHPNDTVFSAGNWSTTTNFCDWFGVSCSRRRQRVTALNLSYVGVHGTISPHIGNLSFLVSLDLRNNSFSSFLPHEIGNLHHLKKLSPGFSLCPGMIGRLFLMKFGSTSLGYTVGGEPRNFNSLTGAFPLVIFNLPSLETILIVGNNLLGTLPMDLCSHCPNLQGLYISINKFSGKLPSQFNNCREVLELSLSYNMFDGSISKGFGSLKKIESLYLGSNNFVGNIPPIISNLSMLQVFTIEENNNIKGRIPSDFSRLQNLNKFDIRDNNLTGTIPPNIFNITSLQVLNLMGNSLSGHLSLDTKISCPNLERLLLDFNKISGRIPSCLSNCSNLILLELSYNLVSRPIPRSLGNLKYLQKLSMEKNQLTEEPGHQENGFLTSLTSCTSLRGRIPMGIGSLKNLTMLDLSYNNLSGNLPSTLGGLEELQRLYLGDNNIGGNIPEELCQLVKLGELFLSNNKISESIPNCIGNLSLWQRLNLSYNKLTSSIPLNVWNLENLLFLDLSSNSLGGSLSPDMRNSIVPSIIGASESLGNLDLSKNSFQGNIPDSFGQLKGLDQLYLSNNNLSGAILKSLEALWSLKYLNLSFNELSGEIPSGGPFANFKAESFLVPPCTSPTSKEARVKQLLLKYIVPSIASIIIFATLVIMLRRHPQYNMQIPSSLFTLPTVDQRMISYHELCRGTNNFCESNFLGIGGFGAVYKGILSNGTTVAVKVLNLHLEGTFKSFDAECKVLRAFQHRNLVKVISVCSSPKFKALGLQYMSNYSLEKWLYSHNYCLNLVQIVGVMVDVARPIFFLDKDMVAHVGDFGIAKILVENKDATQMKNIGTIGYIAPDIHEYGFEGKVSTKGDIYSYGIILLEMITRKKLADEMFVGELSMRQWIASIPDKMKVMDDGFLRIEDGRDATVMQTILSSILELGLRCSEELPDERLDIKDVVAKVNKIKLALLGNRNRGV
ncbi:hypothetical protein ACB092_07G112900 [Castanea dentata]